MPPIQRKGFNTLVSLVAWMIWKHRNRVVLDGISPNLTLLLELVVEEMQKWQIAGAKGLSFLAAPPTA